MAAELIDFQHYYGKLARQEALTEDEVLKLLKHAAHFQKATAFLASCQAATTEGLPAATSKSSRGRHVSLCESAAQLLSGDASSIRFPVEPADAQARCLGAVEQHRLDARPK